MLTCQKCFFFSLQSLSYILLDFENAKIWYVLFLSYGHFFKILWTFWFLVFTGKLMLLYQKYEARPSLTPLHKSSLPQFQNGFLYSSSVSKWLLVFFEHLPKLSCFARIPSASLPSSLPFFHRLMKSISSFHFPSNILPTLVSLT